MKPVLMLAAGAAALSLAACDRNGAPLFGPAAAMKPVSRLDCPDRQGDLKRVSASPDGQTCNYADGDGAEVALQIIRTSGDPHMALRPLEASLATLSGQPGPAEPAAEDDAGKPQPANPADGKSRAAAETAASQANQDAAPAARENDSVDDDADDHPGHHRGNGNDRVNVDLPGVHVKADGEKADVKVFGMQIQADGDRDTAHITHHPRSGMGRSLDFEANGDGGVLRTEHIGRANFRSTVMWMHDNDEHRQYNSVGYVAAGPKTGPLVVAVVKIRGDEKHGVYDNAGKLIRRASRS